jgi:hypothetical protein
LNLHRFFLKTSTTKAMELARVTAIDILTKKYVDAGRTPNTALIAAFVDHSLKNSTAAFTWEGVGDDEQAFLDEVDITDADLTRLNDEQAVFQDELSKTLKKLAAKGSKELFKSLKGDWPAIHADDLAMAGGFEERLETRWGEAFNHIRMLRYVSLQEGGERAKRLGRSRAKNPKVRPHLLLRLHARAVQIVGEILALMEAGYADGAMARWRTLHEVTVVALLINDADEDLAIRFVDHEAVGRLQAANLHQRSCAARNQVPIPEEEMAALEADQAAVVRKYGPEFKKEYGWAATYVGNPDPKFDKLETAAGRATMRQEYKLASYNIHAGSRGLFFKIGMLDGSGLMAGASNAGFDEPGLATLDALVSINFALFPKPISLDDLVMLGALDAIRMAGRTAFTRTAAKLRAEHRRTQRGRSGRVR